MRSRLVLGAVVAAALVASSCSDSTGPDAEGPDVSDFFSVSPGDSFEYAIDWFAEDRAEETTGTLTITCLGQVEYDGHLALRMREFYDLEIDDGDEIQYETRSDTVHYRLTADRLLYYPDSSMDPSLMLMEPLVAGETWAEGGQTIEISSDDAVVNAPAGTFSDCLAVGLSGQDPSMYWSDQVGFWVLMDVGGIDWQHVTELSSYSTGGGGGATVDIADYLPLIDGSVFVYDGVAADQDTMICSGPEAVCAEQVYALCNCYHWIDADGWHIVDWPWSCDKALVFPREISQGTASSIGTLSWTCMSTNESVTVLAGTFDDCIKFKEVGIWNEQVTTEKHFWLARDVGLVKEQSIIGGGCDSGYLFGFDNDGLTLTVQLAWYSMGRG